MTLRSKQWLAPGTAIAAAALLAACSSGSSPAPGTSSSSAGTSPSATSTAAAGLALAQQTVAELEATTSSYPVPTASVAGVSKLKGRTVYYIPLLEDVPTFAVAAQTMKAALTAAGLKLQVCDGQAQPTAIAGCIQQAEGAGAAGIVLDAIPYGMAESALNGAKAKGVPILVADQIPQPATTPNTDQVAYLPGAQDQASEVAWWTIADSGGKANGIIAEEIDSPSSIAQVTDSLAIYKKYCPACVITVKSISATTTTLKAAATSSNLQTHPDATYYYTEFEDSLQPTIQGIQQSGKSSSISDEILRMATGSAPVQETIPDRLFTKQNIDAIQVTTADQASGAWFGSTSFESEFAKLWGIG